MSLSSSYSQILMVVSTVLERNPEINFSKVLKLDEVTSYKTCTHLPFPPSPSPLEHSFYHSTNVLQSACINTEYSFIAAALQF